MHKIAIEVQPVWCPNRCHIPVNENRTIGDPFIDLTRTHLAHGRPKLSESFVPDPAIAGNGLQYSGGWKTPTTIAESAFFIPRNIRSTVCLMESCVDCANTPDPSNVKRIRKYFFIFYGSI